MALVNFVSQGTQYGGQLTFPAVNAGYPQVTIPLYIRESDIPIRQPKITEISTVPIMDEFGYSDGTTQAIFYGAADPLQTSISGYIITPCSPVTDANTGLKYVIMDPTDSGYASGVSLGLQGMSYGDLIWAYLEGKINPIGPAAYRRVDPTSYTDPFGNTYNNVVIISFDCTQQIAINQQNFSMTIGLET